MIINNNKQLNNNKLFTLKLILKHTIINYDHYRYYSVNNTYFYYKKKKYKL